MAVKVGTLMVEIGADVARMQSDLGKMNHMLQKQARQAKAAFGAVGVAVAGAFSVAAVSQFGRAVFDAGRQADQLSRSFKAIAGARAGEEMAFVRQTADELGLSLFDTASAYKNLAASARGTALEGRAAQDVFRAVSEASTALGLSMEDTQGALTALSQMISKGKVSAEELRQQLGERLPGAFQMAARAMGVSTAQLDKMLSQGQVLAEDLLPRLAQELHNTYGQAAVESADSATAAVNRLETAWFDFKVTIAEAGFLDLATAGIKRMAENAEVAGYAIKRLSGEVVGLSGELKKMERDLAILDAGTAGEGTWQRALAERLGIDLPADRVRARIQEMQADADALKRTAGMYMDARRDMDRATGASASGPDWAALDDAARKGVSASDLSRPSDAAARAEREAKAMRDLAEWKIQAAQDFDYEYRRLTMDETAFAIAEAQAQERAWVAAGVNRQLAAEATAARIIEIEQQASQEQIKEAEKAAERQARAMGQVISSIGSAMGQLVNDNQDAWGTIASTAIDAMARILSEWIAMQAAMRAGQAGAGIFGSLGSMSGPPAHGGQTSYDVGGPIPRASGGPTWPGRWLVGENGPEVWDIGANGRGYVHNASATRAMGAASPNIQVNVINQSQQQIETKERAGPDGQIIVDVMVHAFQRGDRRLISTARRALNG